MMKETLKEETLKEETLKEEEIPVFDDVEQQQRSSEIKDYSPPVKYKNKSVKFNEKKHDDDDDVRFIKKL